MTGVPASAAGGPSPAGATGKVSAVGTTGKANPTGASKAGAARPAGADQGAEGDARPVRGGKNAAAAVNQASVWNIANLLTMLRLLLVPAFVMLMLADGGYDPAWRSFAWAAFAIAMITDLFDGHLARAYDLVTDFGKIADPIADKAMTGMAFIGLSIIADFMPAWLWWTATVIVLLREWGVTIARLSIARDVVMPAKQSGKVKTMFQVIALAGLIAPFGYLTGVWEVPGDVIWWISAVLLFGAVLLTLTSGLEFVRDVLRHRREPVAKG